MNKSNSEHIKALPSPKPNKHNTKTKQDSITEDNFVLDEPRKSCSFNRKSCSFKGNRELWKAFVSYSKLNYGSVCHILEPLILAILQSKVVHSRTMEAEKTPIVIENLNVQRVVKRHRRVRIEYELQENFYDPGKGWLAIETTQLNENGHAVGCACKVCRR